MATPRALEAERVAREAIADLRDAWAELIGEEEMDALEAGLRRLRAALWPRESGAGRRVARNPDYDARA